MRDRLGVDAQRVPNGWDPDLGAATDDVAVPELDQDRLRLVHTGKLSGGWGRSPRPLLEALARLQRDLPAVLAGRLQLVLAGPASIARNRSSSSPSRSATSFITSATYSAPNRSSSSRRLMLWCYSRRRTSSGSSPGNCSSTSGRDDQVLALADGNEAARLVSETGIGWTVPTRRCPGDRLRARASEPRRARASLCAGDDLSPYLYPGPAELRWLEILEAGDRPAARTRC